MTVKINASELEGAALDWAVAKAVGLVAYTQPDGPVYRPDNGEEWTPSTDWSQGGPLIERFNLGLAPIVGGWGAAPDECDLAYGDCIRGPTPLIAACRAIVAAKLGNEVEVPDELIETSKAAP